ncbi:MAG: hypothetical protein ACRC62_00440 [Microcoleus sp.]
MSGYFSRLIQQTGIPLAIGKVSDAGNFQDAIAPQIGSEFVPIQIEETQEIQQQAIQEEEFKQPRKVESENIIESELLNHQAAQLEKISPFSSVKTTPTSLIIKEQSAISQEQKLENLSAQVTPFQNAIAAENFPELPKFDRQQPNEITKEPTADSRFTKYTPDRDIPVGTQQCRVPTNPTRKINLQTVLEWVAETPEENPNSQFPIPNSQQQDTEVRETRIAILSDARHPIPDAQFPIPNSQFPNYPTQKTPNFVLSIGTINLTVEAPQSEVKKPPLPPVKSQQEVKPVNQNSRLSRHYIR